MVLQYYMPSVILYSTRSLKAVNSDVYKIMAMLITKKQKIKSTTKRHAKNEKKDKRCLRLDTGRTRAPFCEPCLAGDPSLAEAKGDCSTLQ
jgi:hypothetical protein